MFENPKVIWKKDVLAIDFYESILLTTKIPGMDTPVVLMKPFVENLGLEWKRQSKRLTANSIFRPVTVSIIVESDGMPRKFIAIPIDRVAMYLATINLNRIPEDKLVDINGKSLKCRDIVYQYQEECADALYHYWNVGRCIPSAANARNTLEVVAARFSEFLSSKFSEDTQLEIRDHMEALVLDLLGVKECDFYEFTVLRHGDEYSSNISPTEARVMALIESILADCMNVAMAESMDADSIHSMVDTAVYQEAENISNMLAGFINRR